MLQKVTPMLWFDKECEEAMNFYVDTVNNSPSENKSAKIITIKKYPEGMQEDHMKGMEGKVLTGVFELFGQKFMALDGGPLFKPNESVSFMIECKNQEEIDYYWDKFTSNGGLESQCGWLKDRWGFSWQITPMMEKFLNSGDKEKDKRAMQVMFGMKKIIISDLENA